MKRFILRVIAIFLPWVALLLLDDPMGALIGLILQASIIGWIPASVWAWRSINRVYPPKKAPQTPSKKNIQKG